MDAKEVGRRIRAARERRRWSQAELAAKVQAAPRTVGSWERGETLPQNHIGVLEDVLDIVLTDYETLDIPVPDVGRDIVVRIPVRGPVTEQVRRAAEESARAAAEAALRVLQNGGSGTDG
jgi:transcriptional regulator with XRE-family HTH domain